MHARFPKRSFFLPQPNIGSKAFGSEYFISFIVQRGSCSSTPSGLIKEVVLDKVGVKH
jgi:hypothetical protein